MKIGSLNLADTSPAVLILLLLVAFFFWVEGYRLYKLAVFFLGFMAGYTLAGMAERFVPAPPIPFIIIKILCGLALGAAAYMILQFGLFIAAAFAAFMILSNLLDPLKTVGLVIAFAAAVVAGFIATKADKPVIIVLTGLLGGLMIPKLLLHLADAFSVELSFLPSRNSFIWLIVSAVLAAIGIAIQFSKNKESE